jgi:hypothetical protein
VVRVGVSEVLGDAWDVYTLLFRRSVPIAALVYIFVDGVWVVARESNSDGVRIALTSLPSCFSLPGQTWRSVWQAG